MCRISCAEHWEREAEAPSCLAEKAAQASSYQHPGVPSTVVSSPALGRTSVCHALSLVT